MLQQKPRTILIKGRKEFMFKTFGSSAEVFVNQDEGMFVALPITFDADALTLETEVDGGRTYVKAGSLVKEGDSIRGITAERYDITDGAVTGRIVLEGYAWIHRLTNAAVGAASSLPRLVLIPYDNGTAIEVVSEKAYLLDGREIDVTDAALTLKIGDELVKFEVVLNAEVFLQGTPKSKVTISGEEHDHGNITVDATDRHIVVITPIGANGQIGLAGTFEIKAPAGAVKTAYGVANVETGITLTVPEAEGGAE